MAKYIIQYFFLNKCQKTVTDTLNILFYDTAQCVLNSTSLPNYVQTQLIISIKS